MKKVLQKYFPFLTIIFFTLLAWYKTVNQVFMGEGYAYFDFSSNFILGGHLSDIGRYDNFARVLFDVLPALFKDNIALYMIFQVITLIVLAITIFYIVKYFSKDNVISLAASLIFSTSYVGLFEMIGTGNYQRFVQRVPNIIPELLAFLALAKYLDTKKIKYYLYSLILFSLSVFMAHFSTFMMPIFIIYPFIFSLVNKTRFKTFIKNGILAVPYLLLNLLLINRDQFTPSGHFLAFIREKGIGNILTQITLQFSNITLPSFIIEKLASITSSYQGILIITTIPIIVIFLLGVYLLIRNKNTKLLSIYLLSLITAPILLFLNLYMGKVDAFYNMRGYTYYFLPRFYSLDPSLTASFKGDRYYMLPYIFVSIMTAVLIYALFEKKKNIKINKRRRFFNYRTVSYIFMFFYLIYNISLIWVNIAKIQPVSDDLKKIISYVKSISTNLTNQTVMVVPREFLWPNPMFRALYGYPEIKFLPRDINWKQQISNKKNVVLIDFYYAKIEGGKINTAQNKVIDLTDRVNYNLPNE